MPKLYAKRTLDLLRINTDMSAIQSGNIARPQHCWICKQPYTAGYTIGLLVASNGSQRRLQKYTTVACICENCGNSPGGARRRHPLWEALRDGIRRSVAQIESSRAVLTRCKSNQ